ncbi:MAG: acyl-CoA dehydratase activase [Desulfobacterales bacterium]|jgi:predicted CoA-substrate-specific enzyme activase
MIVAGCDVGSLTAKAVIMAEERILSQAVSRASARPADSARTVMQMALDRAGLAWEDVSFRVGTGYGKDRIAFADRVESEITCHARGAWWRIPTTRTVIDIGGQDAKAIRLDTNGQVIRYAYNDKCASGTGRFLEMMAEALEVGLEDMGPVGQKARQTLSISNQCVIFAETEVVSLVNEGQDVPDIIDALHRAMANRVAALAKGIGVENDVVMTGGVAKNSGVFAALAAGLAIDLHPLKDIDPQINGALGAALIAGQHVCA